MYGQCFNNCFSMVHIRTNMEDLREKTHTQHYELFRQRRLQEMGFTDMSADNRPVRSVGLQGDDVGEKYSRLGII